MASRFVLSLQRQLVEQMPTALSASSSGRLWVAKKKEAAPNLCAHRNTLETTVIQARAVGQSLRALAAVSAAAYRPPSSISPQHAIAKALTRCRMRAPAVCGQRQTQAQSVAQERSVGRPSPAGWRGLNAPRTPTICSVICSRLPEPPLHTGICSGICSSVVSPPRANSWSKFNYLQQVFAPIQLFAPHIL